MHTSCFSDRTTGCESLQRGHPIQPQAQSFHPWQAGCSNAGQNKIHPTGHPTTEFSAFKTTDTVLTSQPGSFYHFRDRQMQHLEGTVSMERRLSPSNEQLFTFVGKANLNHLSVGKISKCRGSAGSTPIITAASTETSTKYTCRCPSDLLLVSQMCIE